MKLECIRPCVMGDGMVTTTVGKVYDVQYETSFGYVIKDDLGDLHEFTLTGSRRK
jgi:hypothetical protein